MLSSRPLASDVRSVRLAPQAHARAGVFSFSERIPANIGQVLLNRRGVHGYLACGTIDPPSEQRAEGLFVRTRPALLREVAMIPSEVIAQAVANALQALGMLGDCCIARRDIVETASRWALRFWAEDNHTSYEDDRRYEQDSEYRPDARPLVFLAALRHGVVHENCGIVSNRWALFLTRIHADVSTQVGRTLSKEQLRQQLNDYLRDTLDTREGEPHALWLWMAYLSAYSLFRLDAPAESPQWWDEVVGTLSLPRAVASVSLNSVPTPSEPPSPALADSLIPTAAQLNTFVDSESRGHAVLRTVLRELSNVPTTIRIEGATLDALQFLVIRYWRSPTANVLSDLLDEEGFRNSRGNRVTINLMEQILKRELRDRVKRRLRDEVEKGRIAFKDSDWERQVLPAPNMYTEGHLLPKPRPNENMKLGGEEP